MTLTAATKRAIDRRLAREGLVIRLRAHAYGIEKTRTCDFDRQLVALLKEAADVLEGKR